MPPPRDPSLLRQTRLLASHHRTGASDRGLATLLAAIAGCANAGGFILLGSYASHMTGYLSQVADQAVLHNLAVLGQALLALACFVTGAAVSAVSINWARRHNPARQYAMPLTVQGALFLALVGLDLAGLGPESARLTGLGALCLIMGFQNATITKISHARIRTTHATGMITDVGIELGKAVYQRLSPGAGIGPDRAKLAILLQLLLAFLTGGMIGAAGYSWIGFPFSAVLAALLIGLAALQRRPRSPARQPGR